MDGGTSIIVAPYVGMSPIATRSTTTTTVTPLVLVKTSMVCTMEATERASSLTLVNTVTLNSLR